MSVVIPAYDESARLPATLDALLTRLDGTGAELIVVDDGSADGTADLARRRLADHATGRVLALPENRGKGAAVRTGVLDATGETIVFMDADLATDLSALDALVGALADADVVIGSRAVPGAAVHAGTRGRALMGRAFNRMVRTITRVPVHDSQCGFKAFRGDVGRLLFGLASVDGFAFDAEVLHLARSLDLRIVEVPVDWTAVEGSSVRPVRDSLRSAVDLVGMTLRRRRRAIRREARALGWDPDRAPAT